MANIERHYQQEVRNQDMTIDELKKRLRNATALNKIDAPFRSQSANPRNVPKYHAQVKDYNPCLLYTSPSPRDRQKSRMPSSA